MTFFSAALMAALLSGAAFAAPASLTAPVRQIAPPASVTVVGASEGPAAGLLDPSRDLGATLWSGSQRGDIVRLLTGSLALPDPALRALTRRMIFSKADAPNGAAPRSLISTRLTELLRAGMIPEAGELAARSKLPGDKDFARVKTDALLYAGRTDVVCGSATAQRLSDAHPFWLELRALCAHLNHNTTLEELTDVVLEARVQDPAFTTLYADLREGKADIPAEIAKPTALHVFLLRQLNLPLPPALAQINATPENLFILQDTRQSLDARLRAAEYLALRGALSLADFHKLMQLYQPASSEIGAAASLAPKLGFVHGQMLLHIAAARASDMNQRVGLMREALYLGHLAHQPFTAARFQADVLKTLKPVGDREMAQLGLALLLAGADDRAGAWLMGNNPLQMVPLIGQSGPAAGGALQALVIRLAGMRAPLGVPLPQAAKSDDTGEDSPGSPRASAAQWLCVQMAGALNLIPEAFYRRYPLAFSADLPGKMPDAAVMAKIRAAAEDPGRHGEAMLRMMHEIRKIGWAHLAPRASVAFVRILQGMGLESHARAFAREAMLLYAPPQPVVQGKPAGDAHEAD